MAGLGPLRIFTGILLTAMLALVWVAGFYHENLLSPGHYLFDVHGDGLANYFSFAWHITQDTSLTGFSGMHYPYGEYLPYVDCHPLLSSILQIMAGDAGDGTWTIALLNVLMLLAPIVTAVFLFLIMVRFGVQGWMATIGAPVIAMLSSQALLMYYGHYALSYSFFFPMGWYLLLRYAERPQSIGWTLAVILNLLVWFYTHNYLGAILLAFTGLVHFLVLLRRKAWSGLRAPLLRFLQVVIPAIIVWCIAVPLDPHTGRIEMPFDPTHTASFWSVFVPNYAMTRPLFDALLDLSSQEIQPWSKVGSYIGIPSIIALGACIWYAVSRVFHRRVNASATPGMHLIAPWLLSSSVLLCVAMGWHFKLTGPEWLDTVPLTKQFVGLGRFAWPFFYVICVATIVLISTIRNTLVRNIVFAVAILVFTLEGVGYHTFLAERLTAYPNYFREDIAENMALRKLTESIEMDRYQAIIPLPFYHKYVTPGTFSETDASIMYSMRLSWLTRLPLVSAVLSRPSVNEGRSIIGLFNPNQYDKPVREEFPCEKAPSCVGTCFLVLATGEELEPLESEMLAMADIIETEDGLILAEIAFEDLFTYDHLVAAEEFSESFDSLKSIRHDWRLNSDSLYFVFEGFDDLDSEQVYRGTGAYSGDIELPHIIHHTGPLHAGKEYILSFWYYNHLYDQVYNSLWIEERDIRDSLVGRTYISPTSNPLWDGPWVWNEHRFQVHSESNTVSLHAKGESWYAERFYLDELMIREAGVEALRIQEQGGMRLFLRNNQLMAKLPVE